jgi:putative membrane protein
MEGTFFMVGFVIRWFANIVSLLAVVKFVPGINVDSSRTLVVAALVLGLVNAVLRPFVLLLTLPINVISLGLLTFFINGFLFYLVSKMVKGFYVSDYLSAFLGAMAFSLVSFLLNLLIKPRDKIQVRYQSGSGSSRARRKDVIDVQARHEKKPQKPEGKNE